MQKNDIPKETVSRLPLYLRCLNRLLLKGHSTVSSEELARFISMSPAKIRKDFSRFGNFGTRGIGYEVKPLIEKIRKILNLDKEWKLALVGVGNVGLALLSYRGFNRGCFKLELVFDDDPGKIGKEISGRKIKDSSKISDLVEENSVHIGIIAVPGGKARKVADKLVRGGVGGIINFTPVSFGLDYEIEVYQLNLAIELSCITYHLKSRK